MSNCTCGQDPHHLPTCPLFKGVRGIDSKRRLLKFFAAKDHQNLVFRIVDVMELRTESLVYLIGLIQMVRGQLQAIDSQGAKRWLLQAFPSGYIVLPIDRVLEPMSLSQVEQIQALVFEYRDIRWGKAFPMRTETCKICGGSGELGGGIDCNHCDDGEITTYLEMSEEEVELARRPYDPAG